MDLDAIKARGEAMVDHVKNRGGAVLKNGAWVLMVQTGGTDIPYLIAEIETYHSREQQKRFAIYVNETLYSETIEYDHAQHVKKLLECDGYKNVTIRVFNANQKSSWANDVDRQGGSFTDEEI
jgi:hypothetical protein